RIDIHLLGVDPKRLRQILHHGPPELQELRLAPIRGLGRLPALVAANAVAVDGDAVGHERDELGGAASVHFMPPGRSRHPKNVVSRLASPYWMNPRRRNRWSDLSTSRMDAPSSRPSRMRPARDTPTRIASSTFASSSSFVITFPSSFVITFPCPVASE